MLINPEMLVKPAPPPPLEKRKTPGAGIRDEQCVVYLLKNVYSKNICSHLRVALARFGLNSNINVDFRHAYTRDM